MKPVLDQKSLTFLFVAGCTLQLLKPSFYSFDQCCSFLISLPLPELATSEDRRVSLASFISFDDISMIRAIGAFLARVLDGHIGDENTNPRPISAEAPAVADIMKNFSSVSFQVSSLTKLELDGRLHLETSVFDYLQIFHADPHPSALTGAPKEGVSLFNMLNRCCSKIGTRLLKNWLLTPLCDPNIISQRLDCIDTLSSWVDQETSKKLEFHLKHVGDLRIAFSRLQIGTATSNDWLQLKTRCVHVSHIIELVRSLVS